MYPGTYTERTRSASGLGWFCVTAWPIYRRIKCVRARTFTGCSEKVAIKQSLLVEIVKPVEREHSKLNLYWLIVIGDTCRIKSFDQSKNSCREFNVYTWIINRFQNEVSNRNSFYESCFRYLRVSMCRANFPNLLCTFEYSCTLNINHNSISIN